MFSKSAKQPAPAVPAFLTVLFALAALAAPATATEPIDDFEAGPFFFQTTGAYQEQYVDVDQPGHVFYSPRKVILEPDGPSDFISAQLDPTYGDDAAEVLFVGDGRVRFMYEWGFPIDLTRNGMFDRVDVEFSFVTPGAYFSLGIGNEGIGCGNERFPAGTSGVVSWDLDFCAPDIDETEATWIGLYLHPNGGDAIFEIKDIRLHRRNGILADIDPHFVDSMVPPIPSIPLLWTIQDLVGQPLYNTQLVIQNVNPVGGSVDMDADFQVLSTPGGEIGHSTFLWNDPGGFFEAEFQIQVDFQPVDGWTPEIMYPPDPIYGEGGLGVTVGLQVRDDGGVPRGTSFLRMTFTEGLEQDFGFENVSVVPTESSKQGGMDGMLITFTLLTNQFDYIFPLFDVSYVCDWQEIDATGVAGAEPAVALGPALVAAPSLTRGATELRAARPAGASRDVDIYDVTGRLVRQLEVPAGAAAVHWDGRDRSGAPTASGTYFARMRDGEGGSATTKVVRIR